MAEKISPQLTKLLQAARPAFNEAFESARRSYPKLDPAIFSDVLRRTLVTLGEALLKSDETRAGQSFFEVYESALALTGQEILGGHSRRPVIERAWREILPIVAPLLSAAPKATIALVTNAICYLEDNGASGERWLEAMKRCGAMCTTHQLFSASGRFAAWIAGLAHGRVECAAFASELPEECLAQLLALPARSPAGEVVNLLQKNPWLTPEDALREIRGEKARKPPAIIYRAGGFRGFGGRFARPPFLSLENKLLVASDGDQSWIISADIFGVTWQRRTAAPLPRSKNDSTLLQKVRSTVAELEHASGAVALEGAAAISHPCSHYVFLVAPL